MSVADAIQMRYRCDTDAISVGAAYLWLATGLTIIPPPIMPPRLYRRLCRCSGDFQPVWCMRMITLDNSAGQRLRYRSGDFQPVWRADDYTTADYAATIIPPKIVLPTITLPATID